MYEQSSLLIVANWLVHVVGIYKEEEDPRESEKVCFLFHLLHKARKLFFVGPEWKRSVRE